MAEKSEPDDTDIRIPRTDLHDEAVPPPAAEEGPEPDGEGAVAEGTSQ